MQNAEDDLLEVLHDEVKKSVTRMGIAPQLSGELALAIESGIRNRIGGRRCYVPAPHGGCKRALVIRDIQAGIKPAVIARRRGVSLRWVYRLRQSLDD